MLREMTEREREILARMLESPFPGRDALAQQLATALVASVHPEFDECFDITVSNNVAAEGRTLRPVWLHSDDATGAWDYYLCVGRDGIAYCMEAVRSGDDSEPPNIQLMAVNHDTFA